MSLFSLNVNAFTQSLLTIKCEMWF